MKPTDLRAERTTYIARPTGAPPLSSIIRACNEEHRISQTLETYLPVLEHRYGGDFEVIVVANGWCVDRAVEIVMKVAEDDPRIRLHEIADRVGKGNAVADGFHQARSESVVFADADGWDRHDVVQGSRRLTSVLPMGQPLRQRMFGALFAVTVRRMFHLPFRDAVRRKRRSGGTSVFDSHHGVAMGVRRRPVLRCGSFGDSVDKRPTIWSDRPDRPSRSGRSRRK